MFLYAYIYLCPLSQTLDNFFQWSNNFSLEHVKIKDQRPTIWWRSGQRNKYVLMTPTAMQLDPVFNAMSFVICVVNNDMGIHAVC